MSSTKIFITGATGTLSPCPFARLVSILTRPTFVGYVGGSVISRLLVYPEVKSFELIALVRTAEKAEKLNALGIKTVVGSYSDLELLTESAKGADIVIAIVSDYGLSAVGGH